MKKSITQESHDEFLNSKAIKELSEKFMNESFDDLDSEIKFLTEFNNSILEFYGYENLDEFETAYENITGRTIHETGAQLYDALLDAVSLSDEEREYSILLDRIRELIISDDEVNTSNRILFYTAMLSIAVDALLIEEELRDVLLDKLKETTLELVEEATAAL